MYKYNTNDPWKFNGIPMNVSKITLGTLEVRVQTPTDAVALIRDQAGLARYVAKYGDVIVKLYKPTGVYFVPAFAQQIREYVKMKTEQCKIYGCE